MSTEPIQILLVEDNPGDARLIHEMLSGAAQFGAPYRLSHAESLQAATDKCSTQQFSVILLDMNLPDSRGLGSIQHFNNLLPQVPIIILTGMDDDELAFQYVEYGAQDYLSKNECTSQLLKRVIHYAIERKRVEQQLKHLASHDTLTGLPNRALFYDRLSQAILHSERARVGRTPKWKGAVILMDLDNFKTINDSLGHDQGDAVLQLAAQRLKDCLRESDTVARLGGDEFIVIVEGISDQADCRSIAQKILLSLHEPLLLEGGQICLSASIGISIYPDDAGDMEALIRNADTAMYAAKRHRNEICFHEG